jgi:Anion-transporting ATPase
VDLLEFFAGSRLWIVAGKGGVGKTTVTAALARVAAGQGLRVLVVEVEGKNHLAPALGGEGELGYDDVTFATGLGPGGTGELRARTISADQALLDYLADKGLHRISGRIVRHGLLDIVTTGVPGIDDILVLGKVKQLERTGAADVILLDGPAAGHAVTFLQSASALVDAVKVGPIHAQAADVLEMLSDPARSQVLLVTLPEETPVNEVTETAFALEDRVGVSLGPVIVNACYEDLPGLRVDPWAAAEAAGVRLDPSAARDLEAAARFRLDRLALQREQIERLSERLPLPQLRLPFLFTAGVGPAEVDVLAAHLSDAIEALVALP